MNAFVKTGLFTMVCTAWLAAAPLSAQDEPGELFGGEPAAAPADAAPLPPVKASAVGDDPAVQAIVDSKPTTPVELFRAVYLLVELQHADSADPFIKRFLAANPTPRDAATILREHGSSRLWRMARVEAIGADGRKMLDVVLDGARTYARDPQRLAELIKLLNHPAKSVRRAAIDDLAAAEGDAVSLLIAALADENLKDQHAGIRDALVAMGRTSIPPLAAAVQANDDAVAVAAIESLGRIGDRSASVYLLGPAAGDNAARRQAALTALTNIVGRTPTAEGVKQVLAAEAKSHLARSVRLPTHGEDRVTLWRWDAAKREVAPQEYHHDDALAVIAARLAGELAAAEPNNTNYRQLNLLAWLEMTKLTTGLDAPLAELPDADAATLNAVLADALAQRRTAAAIGAAQALGKTGAAEVLHREDGRPAALVEAVRDADRRVRFAALAAIMEIGPDKPYAGSSSVQEALCYFASSDGQSRALVIDPRGYRAQTLAAFTQAIGFAGDAAIVGRGGRLMLNQSADYEFVLVDLGVDDPQVYDLLGQLRRDPRTARLPIGIMAGDGQLARSKRLAAAFSRTIAFPQATDVETIEKQAGHLLALRGRLAVGGEVRQRQAELALAWLANLSGKSQSIYDLRRCEDVLLSALESPNLSAAAAEALANLGTHRAQRALVDLASQTVRPIGMRQTAAAAFAKSVPLRGIQLSSDEIVRQYDRYNASRDLNEATQAVLGSILDAIEAPRNAKLEAKAAARQTSLER